MKDNFFNKQIDVNIIELEINKLKDKFAISNLMIIIKDSEKRTVIPGNYAHHEGHLTFQIETNILKIPANINELKNLEHINIAFHSLEKNIQISVHENYSKLDKLRFIQIHTISKYSVPNPNELLTPVNLKWVILTNFPLVDIPENILKLEKLEHLTITDSDIITLNDKISLLKNLEFLDISKGVLKNISKSIKELKKLQHIDFSYNKLDEIPKDILSLENIKHFDITGNPFKNNPGIENLGIAELKKYFNLSSNYRIKVPKELATAVQQYLLFFREYLITIADIELDFDVILNRNFLEIKVEFNDKIGQNEFLNYFHEYISFAQLNSLNKLDPVNSINSLELKLFKANFQVQIQNLNNQIELKSWQVKYLESELTSANEERNLLLKAVIDNTNIDNTHIITKKITDIDLVKEVRNLISSSEILKVFNILSTHNDFSEDSIILLLNNKWNNLQKTYLAGAIKHSDYMIILNEISKSLLDYLDYEDENKL